MAVQHGQHRAARATEQGVRERNSCTHYGVNRTLKGDRGQFHALYMKMWAGEAYERGSIPRHELNPMNLPAHFSHSNPAPASRAHNHIGQCKLTPDQHTPRQLTLTSFRMRVREAISTGIWIVGGCVSTQYRVAGSNLCLTPGTDFSLKNNRTARTIETTCLSFIYEYLQLSLFDGREEHE